MGNKSQQELPGRFPVGGQDALVDDGANNDSKRGQERKFRRFLRLAGFPLKKRTITPIVKRRGRVWGNENLAETLQLGQATGGAF
jgi:hypothetical protein